MNSSSNIPMNSASSSDTPQHKEEIADTDMMAIINGMESMHTFPQPVPDNDDSWGACESQSAWPKKDIEAYEAERIRSKQEADSQWDDVDPSIRIEPVDSQWKNYPPAWLNPEQIRFNEAMSRDSDTEMPLVEDEAKAAGANGSWDNASLEGALGQDDDEMQE